MENNKLAQCDGCRKLVPLADVKYILKPHRSFPILICSACRSEKGSGVDERKLVKKDESRIQKADEKVMYICYSCNYKFKYNPKAVSAPKCPFCGKIEHVSRYRSMLADDLIKECY
mgnify:FL=1